MPRITRRALVSGAVVAVLPVPVMAQATPRPAPAPIDYWSLEGFDGGEAVAFALADPGFSDLIAGTLVMIEAAALAFVRRLDARDAVEPLADMVQAYYESVVLADADYANATFRARDVSMPPLGDDRLARSLVVLKDEDEAWAFGICIIRQDREVQVMVGQTRAGAMTPTIAIAEGMIDRWPGDALTDALPTLSDVPAGMTEVDT